MAVSALEDALHSSARWLPTKAKEALQKADCYNPAAVILNLPRRYIDRRRRYPLASFRDAAVNTVVRVLQHHYRRLGRKSQLVIEVADESAHAELVCFGREKIKYLLPVGAQICLAGNFNAQYRSIQATQFDFEPAPLRDVDSTQQALYSRFNKIVPVYTLSADIQQNAYFRFAVAFFAQLRSHAYRADIRTLPSSMRKYLGAPLAVAIYHAHFPANERIIGRARTILARHELLSLQLRLHSPRRMSAGASLDVDITAIMERHHVSLPFSLTDGQKHALAILYRDIATPKPMKRLLQGDVGVGKTLVALLATLPVLADGGQVAFMVPTELLARQQFESACRFFADIVLPPSQKRVTTRLLAEDEGVAVSLLIGSLSAKERERQLESIASGEKQLVVGTHALFSSDVTFANLRMIIVDEQHRFGVQQRTALLEKGVGVHQLYMTATPIPRTLALVNYVGFSIATITDQPLGRKKIITKLVAQRHEERVYKAVRDELRCGHQAYFVYPLIEQNSDQGELTAMQVLRSAAQMASYLQDGPFADYTVACIHSRVAEQEKEEIMDNFLHGKIHILVATSVIEVGVDVANATCMVINNAERFGLSALHQLRGRVGRSDLQSYAFLIYQDAHPLSDDAKSRLKVLYQHTDGFLISEADLFIRGPGELMGTKQSGTSDLKTVHFPKHLDLLQQARDCAVTFADTQQPAPADASGEPPAAAPHPYLLEMQELFL